MGPHPFRRGKTISLPIAAWFGSRCNGATPFQAWKEPLCRDLTQRNAPYRVIRTQNHGLATAIYSIVNVRTRLTQGILRAVPS